ncbi:unnamed protein product [Enterobius vermicularis]|uniref:Uncharacterized protein n=1 Tax=Enterobius vermicularis TaxID=51028 RepID=A0A0N4VD50_ENTVE|nr:unnamed protein product [Enterobius vermicularis]
MFPKQGEKNLWYETQEAPLNDDNSEQYSSGSSGEISDDGEPKEEEALRGQGGIQLTSRSRARNSHHLYRVKRDGYQMKNGGGTLRKRHHILSKTAAFSRSHPTISARQKQLFNWGKLPWANEKERNGLSAKVSGDFGY